MICKTSACINNDTTGKFHGNLCTPCYDYYNKVLNQSKTENSQAYRNFSEISKSYLKASEIYCIEEKYK